MIIVESTSYDVLDKVLEYVEKRFPTLGIPILLIKASAICYRFFNYGSILVALRSSGKSAVMAIGASGRAQTLTVASVAGFSKAVKKGDIQIPEDHHIFFLIDDLADVTQYSNRIDSFVSLMSSLMFTGEIVYTMGNETAVIKDLWASVVCGGTLNSYEKIRRRDDWDAKNVDRFPLRIHLVYNKQEYEEKEKLSRVWEFLGKEKLVEYWNNFGNQIDLLLGIQEKDITEFASQLTLMYNDKPISFLEFKNLIDKMISENRTKELYLILPKGLNYLISYMNKWLNASESRLTCVAMSLAIFHAVANKRFIISDEDFLWWVGKIDRYIKPDCVGGVALAYYYALCKDGGRSFEQRNVSKKELDILTRLREHDLIEVVYKGVGQTRKVGGVLPK